MGEVNCQDFPILGQIGSSGNVAAKFPTLRHQLGKAEKVERRAFRHRFRRTITIHLGKNDFAITTKSLPRVVYLKDGGSDLRVRPLFWNIDVIVQYFPSPKELLLHSNIWIGYGDLWDGKN